MGKNFGHAEGCWGQGLGRVLEITWLDSGLLRVSTGSAASKFTLPMTFLSPTSSSVLLRPPEGPSSPGTSLHFLQLALLPRQPLWQGYQGSREGGSAQPSEAQEGQYLAAQSMLSFCSVRLRYLLQCPGKFLCPSLYPIIGVGWPGHFTAPDSVCGCLWGVECGGHHQGEPVLSASAPAPGSPQLPARIVW